MPKRYSVSYKEAHDHLSYNPETGEFRWKMNRGRAAKAGEIAGFIHTSGYRRIGVCGALVYAHRLAWLMHYGSDPLYEIDHINRNRDDNRIINLRDVTSLENNQNQSRSGRLPRTRVTTGVMSSRGGTEWTAAVEFMGKQINVRCHSFDEAHSVYLELMARLGCKEPAL